MPKRRTEARWTGSRKRRVALSRIQRLVDDVIVGSQILAASDSNKVVPREKVTALSKELAETIIDFIYNDFTRDYLHQLEKRPRHIISSEEIVQLAVEASKLSRQP